jgi:hypothetical protein
VAGVAVSVKSPGEDTVSAVTVSATEALVLRVPEAPYTFTIVVPSAASDAALNLKVVLDPTFIVVVAGETVTPAGRPLTETCTDPEKPFALFGVTVMVLVCPCTTVTVVSAPTVNVPGLEMPPPLLLLVVEPQPEINATRQTHSTQRGKTFA